MVQIFQNRGVVFRTGFFIIVSLALLVTPVHWVLGWIAAVFFHEFFHYVALQICKVPVLGITVGAFGADIQTGAMTIWQEIIAALAGPLGSFLLLFFVRAFPYVSLCALGHLLFNLVPIYPMDGGRVVTGLCVALFGEERGFRCSKIISLSFLLLLICLSLWISFRYHLGIIPILAAVLIILRALKIPCKERKLIVQ